MAKDWIDDAELSFDEKMARLETLEPVNVVVDLQAEGKLRMERVDPQASPEEVERIATLKAEAELLAYGPSEEQEAHRAEYSSLEPVRDILSREQVWVAWRQDRPLAILTLRAEEPDTFTLSTIYSLFPGQGLGTLLLAAALETVNPEASLTLEVFEHNYDARRYFERLSFDGLVYRPSPSFARERLLIMTSQVGLVQDSLKASAEKDHHDA